MKYSLIEKHRPSYPTRWMCSALEVSGRGFRSWRSRGDSNRIREDRRLLVNIRSSFEQSGRTYGSPRVLKDLREINLSPARKRVARIMRENGLAAIQRRAFRLTTQSGHGLPVFENLLDRQFEVDRPNRVWLADITYVKTEEGWLYLAALLDLYSRRIVGWNTADRMDRWLTLTALQSAMRHRQPKSGLIHHSDRGGQYAAYEYQKCLQSAQATTSMSRKGNCWDNAPMESFFGSLKKERVNRRRYWTRREATADLNHYIGDFYNRKRRHSANGDLSPVRFENSTIYT